MNKNLYKKCFKILPSSFSWVQTNKQNLDFNRHSYAITADQQSNGLGTKGRHWQSNSGGIYLTYAFEKKISTNDKISMQKVSLLTLTSCLICINTIHDIFGTDTNLHIKWPNDIYYNKTKKLGGVKAYTEIDSDTIFCAIGIGINYENDICDETTNFARIKDFPNFKFCNISKKEFTDKFVSNLHENLSKPSQIFDLKKTVQDCNKQLLWKDDKVCQEKKDYKNNNLLTGELIGLGDFGEIFIKCSKTNQIYNEIIGSLSKIN